MSESKRKIFTGSQKAKVALEAVRGMKTINEIGQEYGVHPTQVSQSEKDLLENAGSLFEGKRGPKPVNAQNDPDRLYTKIGQHNMEPDWLKKVQDRPVEERQAWISSGDALALSTQCLLLALTRSVVYAQQKHLQKDVGELDRMLLQLLDEKYTRHPFYGTPRMTAWPCGCGHAVNRKRVQCLMQKLGLAGIVPGPNTSTRCIQRKRIGTAPCSWCVNRASILNLINICLDRRIHFRVPCNQIPPLLMCLRRAPDIEVQPRQCQWILQQQVGLRRRQCIGAMLQRNVCQLRMLLTRRCRQAGARGSASAQQCVKQRINYRICKSRCRRCRCEMNIGGA